MLRITTILTTLALLVSAHPAVANSGLRWPVDGPVVTGFNTGSDPYAAGQHRGIDIAAPAGTPVFAPAGGVVSYSGRLPDGGETVTVRTGELLLSHLHLASRSVARGDEVTAGTELGTVGLSGKRSIEPAHLHFGVREAATKRYIDPLSVLAPRETPAPISQSQPPAEAVPVKKPGSRRAVRELRERPTQKRAMSVEAPARPSLVPATGVWSPKRREPVHRTAKSALRAPAPLQARLSSATAPRPLRANTPLVPEADVDSKLDFRLPLLGLAALLIGLLLMRARRGRRLPGPSDPEAIETTVPNVVRFPRAS